MALSGNKQRPVRIPAGGLTTAVIKLAGYTNYAGGSVEHTVYKGSVMMSDVSDTDGYGSVMHGNAATGDMPFGIAAEYQKVKAANTADGSVLATVYKNGVWGFAVGSVAITDVGADAYASDDDTITTSSSNALLIGIIEDIDDTYVWVNIASKFMVPIA